MSLPASQRRALSQIEKTLANDHSGLGPLFAIFTRLTGHEAMPVTEQVTGQPRRWRRRWTRPRVAVVVGLAMATGALLALSLMTPASQVCPQGTATPVAARTLSFPAGRQPICGTQQNKLSKTSQSGP